MWESGNLAMCDRANGELAMDVKLPMVDRAISTSIAH